MIVLVLSIVALATMIALGGGPGAATTRSPAWRRGDRRRDRLHVLVSLFGAAVHDRRSGVRLHASPGDWLRIALANLSAACAANLVPAGAHGC